MNLLKVDLISIGILVMLYCTAGSVRKRLLRSLWIVLALLGSIFYIADSFLLIIESLSSVDSYRTSQLNNRLLNFDRISHDGILFTNFFANYNDSEGALVALLNGVPPIPFPFSTRDLYRSFAPQKAAAISHTLFIGSELHTSTIWHKEQPVAWNSVTSRWNRPR